MGARADLERQPLAPQNRTLHRQLVTSLQDADLVWCARALVESDFWTSVLLSARSGTRCCWSGCVRSTSIPAAPAVHSAPVRSRLANAIGEHLAVRADGCWESTVGWNIQDEVRRSGIRVAFVDLEQIGFLSPAPADDAGNHRLKAQNLAAMWATYSAEGARCMVVVGSIHSAEERQHYFEALPHSEWTFCRLSVGRQALADRINARGAGQGPRLAGDPLIDQSPAVLTMATDQAVADEWALRRADLGDVSVDTSDLAIGDVTRVVRTLIGAWPREHTAAWGAFTRPLLRMWDRSEPAGAPQGA